MFLLFGFSALKPKPEEVKEGRRFHADWLSVAAAFFIAELGDKTQISALTLAAQHDAHAAIFLGSCLGLLAANLLALAAGRFLMKHISDSALRLFSATVFFLFGSWTPFQLFSDPAADRHLLPDPVPVCLSVRPVAGKTLLNVHSNTLLPVNSARME
ncbi:MAG: TMEM165/GDT1 family protein [Merdibacter sp.]